MGVYGRLIMFHRTLALAVFIATSACGNATDDECTNLRGSFMTEFEAKLAATLSDGPTPGSSLAGPGPDRSAAAKREISHVRGKFVPACRKLGAQQILRCMELERTRSQLEPARRGPRDEGCSMFGKQLQVELYQGFE